MGNFYSNNYIKYESDGDKDKNLSNEEYLIKIKSYLKEIRFYLQKSDPWKVQLKVVINFISSKDANEKLTMHSKSDDVEVMTYDNLDKVIEELFDLLYSKYPEGLKTQMRESDFILDCVNLLLL